MSQDQNKPPQFINITVTVQPTPKGGGNSQDGYFEITCVPDPAPVAECDTVINYQLIAPTPLNIRFTGFDKAAMCRQRELSPPSISVDGRMMTFNDRNSLKEPIYVTLKFRQCHDIVYDPEVSNDPVAGALA